jgi:hypothetical protein
MCVCVWPSNPEACFSAVRVALFISLSALDACSFEFGHSLDHELGLIIALMILIECVIRWLLARALTHAIPHNMKVSKQRSRLKFSYQPCFLSLSSCRNIKWPNNQRTSLISLRSLPTLNAHTGEMPKLSRPSNLKFPQLFATFKARGRKTEEICDYLIQELPEDCHEEALDMLVNEHMPDETLHICRGLAGNADAIREARDYWRKKLAAKISIACFESDGSALVGVNVLGVVSRSDGEEESESVSEREVCGTMWVL